MANNTVIERIKSGDQKAIKDLYISLRNPFFNWLKTNYGCSEEDAKDIYQLSMIIFYDNVMKGKLNQMGSTIRTYVFAIGKNKMKELNRGKNKYALNLEEELKNLVVDTNDSNSSYYLEEIEVVRRAIKDLGNTCQTLLEHFYYYQYSTKEIMKKLNYKSVQVVRNSKYQCMQRLHKLVEKLLPKRA